jgi:hypothetical protein
MKDVLSLHPYKYFRSESIFDRTGICGLYFKLLDEFVFNIKVFCDVIMYCLLDMCQRFGGSCCFLCQSINLLYVKMKAVIFAELPIRIYQVHGITSQTSFCLNH